MAFSLSVSASLSIS